MRDTSTISAALAARLAVVLVAVAIPGAASGQTPDLEGSWEGEFRTPRTPIFLTLHAEPDEGGWTGSIVALGRTFPLQELVPTAEGLRAV
ncbi:MAG: hypothetical protein ACOC83_09885, partial [Gemmatimonadota bacterium]